MHRLLLTFVALFVSVAAVGCQPACPQLCTQNAEFVSNCLEHWEALWPDMGFEDGVEYEEACKERYVTAIRRSGASGARDIRIGCAEDLSQMARSVSCNDYLPNDVEIDPTEGDNGIAPQPGGN